MFKLLTDLLKLLNIAIPKDTTKATIRIFFSISFFELSEINEIKKKTKKDGVYNQY